MKYLIDLCHLLNFNGQKLMYLDIEVLILSHKKRLTNHDWSIYLHVCDRKLDIIDIDQNTIFSLYKVFLLCEIRKKKRKIYLVFLYLSKAFGRYGDLVFSK